MDKDANIMQKDCCLAEYNTFLPPENPSMLYAIVEFNTMKKIQTFS